MSFWNMGTANPKRKFRFLIEITHAAWTGGSQAWYAKTCTAPSVEVSTVEHMWSDHVFNFPGRAKWGDVEMTLVDPAGDLSAATEANTVNNFLGILAAFGYDVNFNGGTSDEEYLTIARNKLQDLGINIVALDDDGSRLETWTLHNPMPIAFKFGDFDYGTDDLREMSVTWKYDWAEVSVAGGDAKFSGAGSAGGGGGEPTPQ